MDRDPETEVVNCGTDIFSDIEVLAGCRDFDPETGVLLRGVDLVLDDGAFMRDLDARRLAEVFAELLELLGFCKCEVTALEVTVGICSTVTDSEVVTVTSWVDGRVP